jgi:class 3 adenylate cyclase/tetratricopeptide (TPR) repeat protein
MGLTALSHSDFSNAYDYFSGAEKKGLKTGELYKNLAVCALKLDLQSKARSWSEKALGLEASNVPAMHIYFNFLFNEKDYDSLITGFKAADFKSNINKFSKFPDKSCEILILTSKSHEKKKEFNLALELAQHARNITSKTNYQARAEEIISRNAAKIFMNIESHLLKKEFSAAQNEIVFLKKYMPRDIKLNQLEESVRQKLRIIEKQSTKETLFIKAKKHYENKEYSLSLENIKKVLELFPGDYDSLILKSRIENALKTQAGIKAVNEMKHIKEQQQKAKDLIIPFIDAISQARHSQALEIVEQMKISGASPEVINACESSIHNLAALNKKFEISKTMSLKFIDAADNYYSGNFKTGRKFILEIEDEANTFNAIILYNARISYALENYAEAVKNYEKYFIKKKLPSADLIKMARSYFYIQKQDTAIALLKDNIFNQRILLKNDIGVIKFELMRLYALKGDFKSIDLPLFVVLIKNYGLYFGLFMALLIFITGLFLGYFFTGKSNSFDDISLGDSLDKQEKTVQPVKSSRSADEILKYQKQLEEEFKTDYMRLSMVINQVKDLTTSLDKEQILKSILDIMIKGIEVKCCSIMMIDDNKRELFTVKSLGLSQEEMDVCISLDTPCFQTYSVLSGQLISKNSARKDEKLKKMIDSGPLPSAASAPLMDRDKVKGIINIADLKKRKLSDEDIQLFKTISSIAGLCMNNAELFDQTREDLISTQKQTQAQMNQKKYIRSIFSRYVSSQVVDQLLNDPSKLKLGGEKMDITILFSDIRGFTSFSEKHSAEEVVSILNEYLSAMTKIILRYGGTLDKYIGDAIMAIYGAPMSMEFDTLKAVITAIHMQKQMKTLQEKWKQQGRTFISMGIGISSGEAVVGNIGSSTRSDYTAIGDNVNLASRLQSQAGPDQIMLSDAAYEKVKEYIIAKPLKPIKVKGKEMPVSPYLVTDINRDKLWALPFIKNLQNINSQE